MKPTHKICFLHMRIWNPLGLQWEKALDETSAYIGNLNATPCDKCLMEREKRYEQVLVKPE